MTIENLALKVASLKKAVSQSLAEGDVESFLASFREETLLRKKLRLEIASKDIIEVESKAAKDVLRKIRSEAAEEEQAITELLSRIEDNGTCGLLVESAADIDELLGLLLYSWFNPREYVLGLFRTGAIVIRCNVPRELKSLINEARQCFAFGQYNAVFSLCRTIIETAVTDIGLRIGTIPKSSLQKGDFYRQYPPWKRIDDVAPFPLRQELHDFYDRASELIHGRKTVGPADSLHAIRSTLKMVEQLYSNKRQALSSDQA